MAQVRYVSYAGIGLGLSTPVLEDRLNQLLPIQDFRDWEAWNFQGYGTEKLPTPPLPTAPKIKLGCLYWPNDATRPAWFHAVVNQTKLDEIVAAIPDPMVPQPLIMQDGREGNAISASMYFLPPRPISQLLEDEDAWLITLTDFRFYWPWKVGNITAPSSWSNLFSQLGTILGKTITPDTIPTEYGTPSSKWEGSLRPPATILDAAASQIGQRVVVSLSGTVTTTQWSTAKTFHDLQIEELRLAAGGLLRAQDIGRYVPRALAVAFADWTGSGTLPSSTPKIFVELLGLLGISEYGSASGLDATGLAYSDTGYDASGNSAICADLAETIATDWYGWRLPDDDLCVPGIEPYEPTGWEDSIEWVAQITDAGPSVQTRIRRGPFTQFASGTFAGDRPGDTPTPPESIGSDCSSLIGLIRDGSCFTLTIGPGDGSCACVYFQSVQMSWSEDDEAMVSDEYVYGCPPGVVTELCGAAPLKFKIVVAGFTGGSTGFNQTYTVTWSTGETWTQVLNGITVTFVDHHPDYWTLTLTDGSTTVVYISGPTINDDCCNDVLLELDDGGGSSDPPAELTAEVVTSCGLGTPYTAYLDVCDTTCDGPQPRLRLVPATGSGAATITMSRSGCSSGQGQFSTSNPIFCTGDFVDDCADNFVTATVSCRPCPTVYRKFASLDCGGICGCDGVTEVPETICISFELTAGSDCLYFALDGSEQELVLVAGPVGSPVTNDFDVISFDADLGARWWVRGAYTLLTSGSIYTNTSADQCATQSYTDALPSVFTFNGGTAPYGYTLSFVGGEWVLTYGSTSFSPTSVDEDAQTITFDVSNDVLAAAAFGATASTLTFLLGGNPVFQYAFRYSGSIFFYATLGAFGLDYCGVTGGVAYGTTLSPAGGVSYTWDTGPDTDNAICSISNAQTLTKTAVGYGSGGSPCNNTNYPTSEYTITLVPDGTCNPNPPTAESFNCLADGTCIDPGDGTGSYLSEIECLAACTGGGGGGGGGDDCRSCTLEGLAAELYIPDGPYAGTYASGGSTPVWTDYGSSTLGITFDSSAVVAACSPSGIVASGGAGLGSAWGVTSCGPPVVMTFPGAAFGATGDVTITTPP